MQHSHNGLMDAPPAHTSEFLYLSRDKGQCSDDYYRAIGEWLAKRLSTDGYAECRRLAHDYLYAIDRYLAYLNNGHSVPNADELRKCADKLRALLQSDINNFHLD